MAQRRWEEKDAAYQAKHGAYLEDWKAKDAAFKAKEKEEISAHHRAYEEDMEVLRKETIERGRAHAAATSAYSKRLALS